MKKVFGIFKSNMDEVIEETRKKLLNDLGYCEEITSKKQVERISAELREKGITIQEKRITGEKSLLVEAINGENVIAAYEIYNAPDEEKQLTIVFKCRKIK